MTAIRTPGKVNENTTLIDIGMMGVAGVTGVYLIKADSGKTCLIDGGTQGGAKHLIKTLENLGSFPPDMIILTHPHWDHTQAVPKILEKAEKSINIMAAEKAIHLLQDQTWNEVFHAEDCKNITGVNPLKEGDIVEVGEIRLSIYDVPGHAEGHIAILDEKNKNIFVGDSVGFKVGDHTFIPNFMPPHWDTDAYYSSIDKLKEIDYQTLSLAHFGYICGDEAKSILDESLRVFEQWWEIFEKNEDRLNDTGYLAKIIDKEAKPEYPDFKIISTRLRILAMVASGGMKIVRKQPPPVGKLLMKEVIEWLVSGYKAYNNI